MAQISFDEIKQTGNTFTRNEQQGPSVGFFSLKNDGDEALVRIMHDSPADFDILTTHPVTVDGKHRRVSCVKENDDINTCPLCSTGAKVEQRIYIHLLQYTKDSNGNIVVEPKVWERSTEYAYKLRDLINEYGPLSNNLFKIKRRGVPKSVDTRYDINYAIPAVYKPELYPNKPELFEGYQALGRAVMNKNKQELAEFVSTGSFGQQSKSEPKQAPWENSFSQGLNNQSPARFY